MSIQGLKAVLAVAEAYPDLKANQTFHELSVALPAATALPCLMPCGVRASGR
jgi:hypothetical protein